MLCEHISPFSPFPDDHLGTLVRQITAATAGRKADVTSACKSGFKTGKRLQLDQTGPEKGPDCSLGLWYLKIKDCKKTGLFGPV